MSPQHSDMCPGHRLSLVPRRVAKDVMETKPPAGHQWHPAFNICRVVHGAGTELECQHNRHVDMGRVDEHLRLLAFLMPTRVYHYVFQVRSAYPMPCHAMPCHAVPCLVALTGVG